MPPTENPRRAAAAVLLSPPGNPAALPEVREFLDREIELHDWRFGESDLPSVHDIVREYRDEVPQRILPMLDRDRHDAMLIACTGMSYGHTPDEDGAYWRQLEERSGVPVATATRAVEELWRRCGYDAMILVSPYDDRATSEAEEYWARAGLPVRRTVRVRGGHPYVVTADDLKRSLEQAEFESGVPILLSGTGMRTKNLLPWVASLHDAPVWSVNRASAEWIETAIQGGRGA